jgi:hypothetical protein
MQCSLLVLLMLVSSVTHSGTNVTFAFDLLNGNSLKNACAKADFSSPKHTCRTFFKAVASGNLQTLKQCSGPIKHHMSGLFDEYCQDIIAVYRFDKAATKRFGDSARGLLPNERHTSGDLLLWLNSAEGAELQVSGTTAVLKSNGRPTVQLHFRRKQGVWKLLFCDLSKEEFEFLSDDPGVRAATSSLLAYETAALTEVTENLESGRIKTLKELREFFEERFSTPNEKLILPPREYLQKAVLPRSRQ